MLFWAFFYTQHNVSFPHMLHLAVSPILRALSIKKLLSITNKMARVYNSLAKLEYKFISLDYKIISVNFNVTLI